MCTFQELRDAKDARAKERTAYLRQKTKKRRERTRLEFSPPPAHRGPVACPTFSESRVRIRSRFRANGHLQIERNEKKDHSQTTESTSNYDKDCVDIMFNYDVGTSSSF